MKALQRLSLADEDWEWDEDDFHEDDEEAVEQEPLEQEGHVTQHAVEDDAPHDMTCAICLEATAPCDLAIIKGCEHQHCVNCILQWTTWDKDWCPQCKHKFEYLYVYRQLDGTMMDYPIEESVVLLKRARWFQEYLKEHERVQAAPPPRAPTPASADADGASSPRHYRDWSDIYEEYVDEELEADEEIEDYYFSSASGRARVVLGNRRWGSGGHVRNGRMYARPLPNGPYSSQNPNAHGGKVNQKMGQQRTPQTPATPAPAARTPSNGAGSSSSASSSRGGFTTPVRPPKGDRALRGGDADFYGSSPSIYGSSPGGSGSGRRAKRAARRAAMDAAAAE